MDELVKLVAEKTDLSEEKSRQAVEIVLEYLKQRLPEPVAGQIDSLVEGKGTSGVMGSVGGLFGG